MSIARTSLCGPSAPLAKSHATASAEASPHAPSSAAWFGPAHVIMIAAVARTLRPYQNSRGTAFCPEKAVSCVGFRPVPEL
eukprot:981565-Rhodomonas_salina.3